MSLYQTSGRVRWQADGIRELPPRAARSMQELERVIQVLAERIQDHRTGDDQDLVTGAAGASGELAEWSADGGLVDSGVTGDDVVEGPASATDENLARFNGTTGKLLEDSGVSISELQAPEVVELTISGGAIALPSHTVPKPWHIKVTANSNPEDLNNVTGGVEGDVANVLSASSSNDPNLVDSAGGSGQMFLSGGVDRRLNTVNEVVQLVNRNGTVWIQPT